MCLYEIRRHVSTRWELNSCDVSFFETFYYYYYFLITIIYIHIYIDKRIL